VSAPPPPPIGIPGPPHLVPYLASPSPSAVLPPLDKAPVEVGTDDPGVHYGAVEVAARHLGILVGVEEDEAETAGGQAVSVEAHDDAADVANLAKGLHQLIFRGEEAALRGSSGGDGGGWE